MHIVTGAVIVLLLAMAVAAWWLISVSESDGSGVKRPTDVPPRNDPQLRMEKILRRATDLAKTGGAAMLRKRRRRPTQL